MEDDEYEFEQPDNSFEDLQTEEFIGGGEDEAYAKEQKSWKEHLLQKKEWKNNRRERRDKEQEEIDLLEKRIQEDALPKGTNPLAYTDADTKKGDYQVYYPAAKTFADLPISTRTKKGLKEFNFTNMTEIQRAAIPHALCGRDILGAAKTGSGKTLAFVIPVIEKLFRSKWNVADGLGAIVITPNRELAVQIFEVMRKVGRYHSLSCGLVIGGKSVKFEKERIYRMNILICTPGRLLQHMDETTGFECTQLQILVLDEADQILDMGFEKTLNSIVEGLPPTRQTLLFSATQTKSVKDLARLSLQEPEYVSVHEKSENATPVKLIQHVVIVNLQEKIDTLWSFVKSHLNSKVLVFLSSCKQVRFVYEAFRKLRPGIQLMAINGKMKQLARTTVFFEFVKKKSALLFATDIAARGLDFPSVDWVLQVDCPENVQTYIHRVGRTARYNSSGNSLLMLLPSESKMVDTLQASKIPVKVIKVNPNQQKSITSKLEEFLVQDQELKYLAQKAFISYMRSIFLMGNKEIFNVYDLPAAEFAKSMGLPSTPRIKYIKAQKVDKNYAKSALEKKLDEEEQKEREEKEGKKKKPQQVVTHVEKLFNRKSALADNFAKLRKEEEEEESEDDLLVPKRMNHKLEEEEEDDSSDEDEDADKYIGEEVTGKRKTFVPSDDESEEEEEEDVKRKKKQIKVPPPQPARKPAKAMSLADTEQLALQILQKRKL